MFGFVPGIILGCLSGVVLGLCTGILASILKIKPVLAGIITFTGSLTVAYLLTSGGRIDLTEIPEHLMTSVFTLRDFGLLAVCATLLCLILAVLSATKFGVLVLAMTGDTKFLKFRHRYKNRVFIMVTLVGNGIVAFSGGLHAIRDTAANVQAHFDFLPLSLGGIFAANAVTVWASKLIGEYDLAGDTAEGSRRSGAYKLKHSLARLFSVESEDSKSLFLLLVAFVIGCFCFVLISRAVQAQVFFAAHPAYHHITVAALMVLFVWWAGTGDE
jgi:putative ABC transport system permease protein